MELRVVSEPDELLSYVPAWEELAEAALEPNPFYEHWMLLPMFEALRSTNDIRIVLLLRTDPARNSDKPLLCGVFPLERHQRYNGFPVPAWSLFRHAHCFLTTPLLRKEYARECISALFDWLLTNREANLIEWRYMPGDGPFQQLLVEQLQKRDISPFVREWFTRAFFKPGNDADRYFSAALSGKHRKQWRRRTALLAELGPIEFALPEPGANIVGWTNSFLKLEASGWKGQQGSALLCREMSRTFFVQTVSEAFHRNRLLMPAILLNGNPIAQNCYFRAGRGVFHFKTAFDEEYGRFSPGFHLECELVRYLHSAPDIDWMDSCTSPQNEMLNRLYLHRRTIQSLLIPAGKGLSGLVVSAMPLLKFIKRSAKSLRHSEPKTLENGNDF